MGEMFEDELLYAPEDRKLNDSDNESLPCFLLGDEIFPLKLQSCKFYNNKYTIVSTQITNTEIFTFIAALVFRLLSRKVLFINRKDNRNC